MQTIRDRVHAAVNAKIKLQSPDSYHDGCPSALGMVQEWLTTALKLLPAEDAEDLIKRLEVTAHEKA